MSKYYFIIFAVVFGVFCASPKLPTTVPGERGPSDEARIAIAEMVIRNKGLHSSDSYCFVALDGNSPSRELFIRLNDLEENILPINEWENVREYDRTTLEYMEYKGKRYTPFHVYRYEIWIRDWVHDDKVAITVVWHGLEGNAFAYWKDGRWSMSTLDCGIEAVE